MPGSLQALGVIRRTVELELMLSASSSQQEISLPFGLIDELEGLYPASVVSHAASSEVPEEPTNRLNWLRKILRLSLKRLFGR